MQLFGSKSLSYLGVDIGNAGIKIVELKNENGRPRLVTYGYADFPVSSTINKHQETEVEIASLIKKICSGAGVTTNKTIAALPNFSVFSSVISLPQMKKNELDQAVLWEAKKFVPLPIEEMNLYSEVIEEQKIESDKKKEESKKEDREEKESEKGKHLKVLIVAAPKKNVDRYMKIFQTAEMDLINLETESFALERSLVGHENVPVMIIDIGSVSADISIVDRGIPVINRIVDTGGASITRRIAKMINVDLKRAEQFKKDIGFSTAANSGQGVPRAIESSIEPIINEIKYCFDLYSSQGEDKRVEKVVLTGGSAYLPNLVEYLSKLLNIKVIIGDPWARVIYPVELKTVLDQIGPRFAVAVGLAMREIE
ncbi:MAG: type IV pilus assembly protein PilM [Patescibacteria group bacterium]